MFRRRLSILVGAILLGGAVLLARLVQVQVGWHDEFVRADYERAGGDHIVETLRGGIYTRWGTPLAVQVPSFDLAVHYRELRQDGWKGRVSALCGVPVDELTETAGGIIGRVERIHRAVRARRQEAGLEPDVRILEQESYHPVVEGVAAEVAAAVRVRAAGMLPVGNPGGAEVRVLEHTRRRYPNGDLAPHVVGEMGPVTPELWEEFERDGRAWTMAMPVTRIGTRYKMDDRLGIAGIEKACEDLLRGRRGHVRNRWVFKVLRREKSSLEAPPEPGADVYLTLRADFQRAANAALGRAAGTPELEFTSGALVIVDVRDGSVLAAATWPSYDLATHRDQMKRLLADQRAPLFFRPLKAALPTGSVYKVITALAALEEGAIDPSTTFTCHRQEVFSAGRASRTFHCTGQHGTIDLLPAIEKSCNVYFYNTGLAVGGEALGRWGRAFGLGMPTGVDLPYENAGQVPDPRHTYGVLNLSIGQGNVECTPLQVANAMAAVANGGRLHTPHFFSHARGADGELVRRYEPRFERVPVSDGALRVVREGMRRVVESGTARRAGLSRFGAAGKTGTAERGRDLPNHAWFAGFAPHDAPKIAFAAVSENTPGHGGSHAAPIVAFALEEIWGEVEQMR